MRDYDQSLWRQTCRERIDTQKLSDDVSVDLAVIGGGYTGCSAALTAAKNTARSRKDKKWSTQSSPLQLVQCQPLETWT